MLVLVLESIRKTDIKLLNIVEFEAGGGMEGISQKESHRQINLHSHSPKMKASKNFLKLVYRIFQKQTQFYFTITTVRYLTQT